MLSKTVKEKYLAVTINANMKVEQCRIVAPNGNPFVSEKYNIIIKKMIDCTSHTVLAICIPHLKDCIRAWRSYLRDHIILIIRNARKKYR